MSCQFTDCFDIEIAESHDRREHSHLAFRGFGDEHDEAVLTRVLVTHVLVLDAVHEGRHLDEVNVFEVFLSKIVTHSTGAE